MQIYSHRILIVDDNEDDRFFTNRALEHILNGLGTINSVSSGKEAVAYLVGDEKFGDRTKYPFPTLVLTDLNMVFGDGFDVLEFLQSRQLWSGLPRIVLSSSNDSHDAGLAHFLGASAYHKKPVNFLELEHLLRQILSYWTTVVAPRFDDKGQAIPERRYSASPVYLKPSASRFVKRNPMIAASSSGSQN